MTVKTIIAVAAAAGAPLAAAGRGNSVNDGDEDANGRAMNALAARTALSALYAASSSTSSSGAGSGNAWTTVASAAAAAAAAAATTAANATAVDVAGARAADDVDPMPRFTLSQTVFIALISGLLSFITVSGNIMVMVSFKIDKQLQNISNYFLFSLALADFFIGLISMPLFTVYTILGYWPFGRHVCDGWLALDYLASNASVLNLLLISFDRYLSVTRPLTYRAKRTKGKALLFICEYYVENISKPMFPTIKNVSKPKCPPKLNILN